MPLHPFTFVKQEVRYGASLGGNSLYGCSAPRRSTNHLSGVMTGSPFFRPPQSQAYRKLPISQTKQRWQHPGVGIEPRTFRSQVRRPNHSATPLCMKSDSYCLSNFFCGVSLNGSSNNFRCSACFTIFGLPQLHGLTGYIAHLP